MTLEELLALEVELLKQADHYFWGRIEVQDNGCWYPRGQQEPR